MKYLVKFKFKKDSGFGKQFDICTKMYTKDSDIIIENEATSYDYPIDAIEHIYITKWEDGSKRIKH